MRSAVALLGLLALLVSLSPAQEANGDSTSFDFWVGRWTLTWKDPDSTIATGENTVRKIMGGTVIQENFRGLTGTNAGFDGVSLSVYTAADGRWRQTWVDNQKSYLDFTGGTMGEKRYFSRQAAAPDGKKTWQRMVFFNIARDRFDWDWERSADGGKHWTLQWRIHYERKKD